MPSSEDTLLYELEDELHDLCQPLTALHFRLEIGKFGGDPEALREAVDGALEETGRMIEAIRRMRERLTGMEAERTARSNAGAPRPLSQTMARGATR